MSNVYRARVRIEVEREVSICAADIKTAEDKAITEVKQQVGGGFDPEVLWLIREDGDPWEME